MTTQLPRFVFLLLMTLSFLSIGLITVGVGIALLAMLEQNQPSVAAATMRLNRRMAQWRQRLTLSPQAKPLPHFIKKCYKWSFNRSSDSSHFSISLQVDRKTYQTYRQRRRDTNAYRFDKYVTPFTAEVEALATTFDTLKVERCYDSYEQLCNIVAFVQQSIRYEYDRSPLTGQIIEYPKYPIETLVEGTGDCEDQAILAAAILYRLGYEVALLILPRHVALGVAGLKNNSHLYLTEPTSGTQYLYIEMTVVQWPPGQIPHVFEADIAQGDYDILPIRA